MGSLISSPKAPAPRPVYITPPPPSTPPPASTGGDSSSGGSGSSETEVTPEQQAAEDRKANLLRRNRGIFGTVQTGFRGLLGLSGNAAQRKTLLGE